MTSKAKTPSVSQLIAKIICQGPDIDSLSPEELEALHVMKYEMLAALHRLYMVISPDIAEPIIRDQLTKTLFLEVNDSGKKKQQKAKAKRKRKAKKPTS